MKAALAAFRDGDVWSGWKATPTAVRDALAGADVAHLSCHGRVDLGRPLDSALIMAGEEPLRLADLLVRRLRARLVVASACESGVLARDLPDEVVSLPTGMLHSGATAVVASLWSVPGFATAMLMLRFYVALAPPSLMDPAEALRTAQLWVRDTTNAEKAAYLAALSDGPFAEAARGLRRALLLELARPGGERTDAHPYSWAAFAYWGPLAEPVGADPVGVHAAAGKQGAFGGAEGGDVGAER